MERERARTVANLVFVGAGVTMAYFVWRTPSLRRVSGRLVKMGLSAGIPGFLAREIQQAWTASGRGRETMAA